MDAYLALVDQLVAVDALKTPRIIQAFKAIHRRYFLPEEMAAQAGLDMPLPIGQGQTNSQPYTVAFMLELLAPKPGQNVLDIGFGSGWTSALLAHIVKPQGRVYAFEVIKGLCEFGKKNIEHVEGLGLIGRGVVNAFCKNAADGVGKFAPFNRILVSAAADRLNDLWLGQLTRSGRLVAPIQQSIWLIEKDGDNINQQEYPGFSFVPLV